MTRPTKTNAQCVNGCNAPPQKPSKALCKKCWEELDKKMEKLREMFTEVPP
jgi:hypothetical protein